MMTNSDGARHQLRAFISAGRRASERLPKVPSFPSWPGLERYNPWAEAPAPTPPELQQVEVLLAEALPPLAADPAFVVELASRLQAAAGKHWVRRVHLRGPAPRGLVLPEFTWPGRFSLTGRFTISGRFTLPRLARGDGLPRHLRPPNLPPFPPSMRPANLVGRLSQPRLAPSLQRAMVMVIVSFVAIWWRERMG